jgi:hypothetical protein
LKLIIPNLKVRLLYSHPEMKRLILLVALMGFFLAPHVNAQIVTPTPAVKTTHQAICIGHVKNGQQCTKKAAHGSQYCKMHDPAVVKCAGITKAGTPCGSLPMKGSKYCKSHQPKTVG